MTEQLVLTITATSIGFVSAVFFCIGNSMNMPSKILLQATPFWDFSEPVARALAAQRAQYVIGAMLLVVSFSLQVVAALACPTSMVILPQPISTWPYPVLFVLVLTGVIAGPASLLLYKLTINKVLRLEKERAEEEIKKRGQ